jgi:hypothetical protein
VIDSLMIVFFFFGHSGMAGYCAEMDTISHERVFSYDEKRGFFHCTDLDFPNPFQVKSGSPAMPFLKAMAKRYPKYKFCGIKYGHACGQAFHVFTEDNHKVFFNKRVEALRTKAIIGGVMVYYGYIEGQHRDETLKITESIHTLVNYFRSKTDPELPVLFVRYEINSDRTGTAASYRQWDSLMIANTEAIPWGFSDIAIIPVRYLLPEHYCDNHHPNKAGYEIIGEDGVAVYQLYNFDRWNK